ncbi:MAG: sigma-70 family RNA polymerase sigma factor [Cyclobacteriaceae bacterium]|nr:sigma-70 family RNA polymerase sigma factor [Cyclobacteriaceae bacterium]
MLAGQCRINKKIDYTTLVVIRHPKQLFQMESQDFKNHKSTVFKKISEAPNDPQKVNEAKIWLKFKKGDEEAFVWIYRNYFVVLYNFARQFNLDSDYVKDQIQDLFIYIRSNRERLTNVNSIKFYLFKSLRRKLLTNKKQKFSFLSLFSSNSRKIFEIEITETPEVILINQSLDEEIKERLSKSMNKLTIRQKEAVIYFYYEGMSYQEIADIMGLQKVKSARKLIYRAIEALRKDLLGFKATLY